MSKENVNIILGNLTAVHELLSELNPDAISTTDLVDIKIRLDFIVQEYNSLAKRQLKTGNVSFAGIDLSRYLRHDNEKTG